MNNRGKIRKVKREHSDECQNARMAAGGGGGREKVAKVAIGIVAVAARSQAYDGGIV